MSYLRTVTLRILLLNNARLTEIKLFNLSTGYFIFISDKRTAESNLTSTTLSTMLQTILTAHFDDKFLGVNKGQSKIYKNNPKTRPGRSETFVEAINSLRFS